MTKFSIELRNETDPTTLSPSPFGFSSGRHALFVHAATLREAITPASERARQDRFYGQAWTACVVPLGPNGIRGTFVSAWAPIIALTDSRDTLTEYDRDPATPLRGGGYVIHEPFVMLAPDWAKGIITEWLDERDGQPS